MNTPTYDEIARQAYQLWEERGCPEGQDTEIWLAAERRLSGDRAADPLTGLAKTETPTDSVVGYQISPSGSGQEALTATAMKHDSRAPQAPHHTGPKSKPAETGKPLWSRPHSS